MDIITNNITATAGQTNILLFTSPGFILIPSLIFLCMKVNPQDDYPEFPVDGTIWKYVKVNDSVSLKATHGYPTGKIFVNMNLLVVAKTFDKSVFILNDGTTPYNTKFHLMNDNEHNTSMINLENSLNNKTVSLSSSSTIIIKQVSPVNSRPVPPIITPTTSTPKVTTFYQIKPITSNKTIVLKNNGNDIKNPNTVA